MIDRRDLLLGAAGMGATWAFGDRPVAAAPSCVLTPEQLRGPYYIDDEILRPDIASGMQGLPTTVRIALVDVAKCSPLSGAAVDVWHCDADGLYSGFRSYDPDKAPVGIVEGRLPRTDGDNYLRGVQVTDRHGEVEFRTIFPGWYYGRATHFHLKVHLGGLGEAGPQPEHVCFTGQLFFPEDVAAAVDLLEPYSRHTLARTPLERDFVFTSGQGKVPMLDFGTLPRHPLRSLTGRITLAVDPHAMSNPPRGPSQGGAGPSNGAPNP